MTYNPRTSGERQEKLGVPWPARLAKIMSLGFLERLCLKITTTIIIIMRSNYGRYPLPPNWSVCIDEPTRMAHTQTQRKKEMINKMEN